MTARTNPVVWLSWAFAATVVLVSTRNPLYLALAGLAIAVVQLRIAPADGSIWRLVIRITLLAGVVTVLFNLLTVHAGDRVFGHLPDRLPIAGGDLTWNAAIYGLTSATVIVTLILVAAVLTTMVNQASLLRLVPQQFATAGVAAVIGLSFVPQTLVALREVREAQAARGFQVRSIRDVEPLVLPVLQLGLERAFHLAEALESRAFGAGPSGRSGRHLLPIVALVVGLPAVVLLFTGSRALGLAAGLVALIALVVGLRATDRRPRGQYRPVQWSTQDALIVIPSAVALLLMIATLALGSGSLSWSPYPRLTWPPFSPAVGLACLLLAIPALAPTTGLAR